MVWLYGRGLPQVSPPLLASTELDRFLAARDVQEPLRRDYSHQPDRKLPTFLADHVEKNGLQGKLQYNLFVGASSGAETENRWAGLNMIDRRSPHQVGKEIAKGINEGRIRFFDKHLSMFPTDLVYVGHLPI